MTFVAMVSTPPPSRRRLLGTLVAAELRQLWWLQLAVLAAGAGVWALLLAVTARVPTNATPPAMVFNLQASLVLSVFPVLLAASRAGGVAAERVGVWLSLPLPRREVHLLRLTGPAGCLWPAFVTWPPIIALLARVYGPVSGWVVAAAALVVVIALLAAMRFRFAAILVYAAVPLQAAALHLVPAAAPGAAAWLRLVDTPWATAALLVFAAGLGRFVLGAAPAARG